MKLNICSAVYYCEEYINTNVDIINLRGLDWIWYVVQNTPVVTSHLGNHKLSKYFYRLNKSTVFERPQECTSDAQMQHGLSLNKGLRASLGDDADFVLLLDPDFYIFRPIAEILKYMDDNEIRIFGAPYMSKTPLIENFPVGFCMFIDVRHIPINTLDFTPGYGNYIDKRFYPDVGYKVYYDHLFNQKTKFEIVIPSAKEAKYIHTNKTLESEYGIKYDNPINRKGTKIDEYWWKDEIFAVHLRTKLHQGLDKDRFDRHMTTIKQVHQDYIKQKEKNNA